MGGLPGITDTVLIGSGRMNWHHGFTVSKLVIEPSGIVPSHEFTGADVWFVQTGNVEVSIAGESARVGPGDTITFPANSRRALRNVGQARAELVCVRTDNMAAA